ncbi:MAG TPA: hypothetical protein VHV77_01400, partial [Pirellulales bacterium]|nr:hypothetical protein [Pirellulales bacterium]
MLLFVAVPTCLAMPGCGGCQQNVQKPATPKDDSEKRIPDFEWRPLTIRPAEARRPQTGIKPGHWASTMLEARANKFDERGELQLDVIPSDGVRPLEIDGTRYRLVTAR